MNILQINTVDREGGAARIASDIKASLESSGNKINYFVKIKKSDNVNTSLLPDDSLMRSLSNKFKEIVNLDPLSAIQNHLVKISANDIQGFKSNSFLRTPEFKQADLIHLHNLHGNYFPLNSLKTISALGKPIVWTMHDMWPITGHCSHSFECNRWKHGCGNCPHLDTYPAMTWDNTKSIWRKKDKIYSKFNATIVSPSKWMYKKISDSILSKKDQRLIYNGVDIDIFKPQNKQLARKFLNLPKDKTIIMFLANGSKNSIWKGVEFLEKIQQIYRNRDNIHFLCIGGSKNNNYSNKRITYIEKIDDQKLLTKYYSSADLLIFPSLAETFPLVILEAMACGLPIVSFDVGGVGEALIHKKHGYLVKYKNIVDLTAGIEYIIGLSSDKVSKMKISSVNAIKNKFSKMMMINNYKDLYNELIDSYVG